MQNQIHVLHHSEPQTQTSSDLLLFFKSAVWFELTIQTVRKTSSFVTLSDRTPLRAPHTGWADKSVAKYISATGPLHCGTGTAPCASLPIRPKFLLAIRVLLIQAVLDWFLNCWMFCSMLRVKSSLHGKNILTYDARKAPFCKR